MADQPDAKADTPEQLEVVTTSRLYTYPGHSPHPIGSRLRLPHAHALELIENGHAARLEEQQAPEGAAEVLPAAEPTVEPAGMPQHDATDALPAPEAAPAAVPAAKAP